MNINTMKIRLIITFIVVSLAAHGQHNVIMIPHTPAAGGDGTCSYERWGFNNTGVGEEGNITASLGGGATYETANKVEGTHAVDVTSANEYVDLGSITYPADGFTIMVEAVTFAGTPGEWMLWAAGSSNNIFEMRYDFNNDRFVFKSGNGSTTQKQYSDNSTGHTNGTWSLFAIEVDFTVDSVRYYLDGDYKGNDPINYEPTTLTLSTRLGLDLVDGTDFSGHLDAAQFYEWKIGETNMATIAATPLTEVCE